ncbi:MAG TPA: hypothetical protein VGL84_07510 [Gaiellaceae bacterium]|jgi:hypothetical protein
MGGDFVHAPFAVVPPARSGSVAVSSHAFAGGVLAKVVGAG